MKDSIRKPLSACTKAVRRNDICGAVVRHSCGFKRVEQLGVWTRRGVCRVFVLRTGADHLEPHAKDGGGGHEESGVDVHSGVDAYCLVQNVNSVVIAFL